MLQCQSVDFYLWCWWKHFWKCNSFSEIEVKVAKESKKEEDDAESWEGLGWLNINKWRRRLCMLNPSETDKWICCVGNICFKCHVKVAILKENLVCVSVFSYSKMFPNIRLAFWTKIFRCWASLLYCRKVCLVLPEVAWGVWMGVPGCIIVSHRVYVGAPRSIIRAGGMRPPHHIFYF